MKKFVVFIFIIAFCILGALAYKFFSKKPVFINSQTKELHPLSIEYMQTQKIVEFYTYEGYDHNLSNNLDAALERSVAFFDKCLRSDIIN